MPLISLSELRGDELLGVELRGLPAPVVPLLREFFAVLFDLSERHLEAGQLGFSRRQLGREVDLASSGPPEKPVPSAAHLLALFSRKALKNDVDNAQRDGPVG